MSWSRLLEELLRRARPPAASRVAERWTGWARRLVAGRARSDAAGAGWPMTLVAPAGAARAADRGSWVRHRLQLAVRVLHAHEHTRVRMEVRPGTPNGAWDSRSPGTGRASGAATESGLGVPPRPQLVLRAPIASRPEPRGHPAPERGPAVAAAAGHVAVRSLVERRRRVVEPSRGGRAPMAEALRAPGEAAMRAGPAGVDPQTGWAVPVAAGSSPLVPAPLVLRAGATAGAATPAASAGDTTAGHRPAEDDTPEPVDIERLADQVVRQIDRRIVAHRERVGRI